MASRSLLKARVRFGETDAAGIVFYPTYFTWFDHAAQAMLRIDGASGRGPDGKPKYPLPIVECGATFLAPLQYDEDIEIVTTVGNLGESSLRFEHEVRNSHGKTVARGFEQRVFVAVENGRITKAPIPEELRAHLSAPPEND